ncbi:hypothetical protein NCCP2716_26790 [Sporosarcina sp. NCCP-2716]|nr:hypothetical protein NCCP2716_26790 [Sporosarcina sp. NCCP-2716]
MCTFSMVAPVSGGNGAVKQEKRAVMGANGAVRLPDGIPCMDCRQFRYDLLQSVNYLLINDK